MSRSFDLVQTFYVDKKRVADASVIYITSIALYFKQKPDYESDTNLPVPTKSGIRKPGVTVALCPVEEEVPILSKASLNNSVRKEHENISTSTSAATETLFTFSEPIPVTTNKQYGICIKFDGSDPDFQLWQAKNGENEVGTNIKQNVSSGKTDGNLYIVGNGDRLESIRDADLTYYIKIAKFSSSDTTFKIYNKKYEFLNLDTVSQTNSFFAGEMVYKNTSPITGTVATTDGSFEVTGSGTNFSGDLSTGSFITIKGGTTNVNIRVINSITNATHLTLNEKTTFTNASSVLLNTAVGRVVSFNRNSNTIVLKDTNVNSSLSFASSSVIVGELSFASANVTLNNKLLVNDFRNQFKVFTPVESSVNTFFNFSEYVESNTTSIANTSRRVEAGYNTLQSVDTYLGHVISSTQESNFSTPLTNFDGRSFQGTLIFRTDNLYTSPYVKKDSLDLMTYTYLINSNTDATNEYLNTGNAEAKYISKRITLAEGQNAEDIRVYLTAFRPSGTDVRVFAKIKNVLDPESFDDKNWTELEPVAVTDKNLFSNPSNKRDYVELEYKFREYPIGTTLVGTVNTTSTSALVNGVSTGFNTDLAAGNLVKIYNSLFPNNYHIGIVNNVVNDTSLYLTRGITNTNAIGTGLSIDKISTYKNQAFTNRDNDNVVRYYNGNNTEFDTFKMLAIKIVLVSDDEFISPIIDNYRAVALSA
jgi:hypothetical protein